MGLFSPPHTAVLKKLPGGLQEGARQIESAVSSAFPSLDSTDRSFCILIALAAWVNQLDEAGLMEVDYRHLPYIYEAARIAAGDMRRKDALDYLDLVLSKMDLRSLNPVRSPAR